MIVCKEGGGVPWSLVVKGKKEATAHRGPKEMRGGKKGQILFSPLPQKVPFIKKSTLYCRET